MYILIQPLKECVGSFKLIPNPSAELCDPAYNIVSSLNEIRNLKTYTGCISAIPGVINEFEHPMNSHRWALHIHCWNLKAFIFILRYYVMSHTSRLMSHTSHVTCVTCNFFKNKLCDIILFTYLVLGYYVGCENRVTSYLRHSTHAEKNF